MADGGTIEKKARKKSEKRQREIQTKIRWLQGEFNDAAAEADAAGLSFAAWVRVAATKKAPGVRAQRQAPHDAVMFRQAMGDNNRVGNNINQLTRYLHEGEPLYRQVPELKEALRAYIRVTNALLEAMGKQPMEVPGKQPMEPTP